ISAERRHATGLSSCRPSPGDRPRELAGRCRATGALSRRGSRLGAFHTAELSRGGRRVAQYPGACGGLMAPDRFTLQIIRNYWVATAQEMVDTTARTAYSPTFSEGHDFSCALFDTGGRMIIQSRGVGIHLGSLVGAMAAIRDRYKVFAEGDIVMTN